MCAGSGWCLAPLALRQAQDEGLRRRLRGFGKTWPKRTVSDPVLQACPTTCGNIDHLEPDNLGRFPFTLMVSLSNHGGEAPVRAERPPSFDRLTMRGYWDVFAATFGGVRPVNIFRPSATGRDWPRLAATAVFPHPGPVERRGKRERAQKDIPTPLHPAYNSLAVFPKGHE